MCIIVIITLPAEYRGSILFLVLCIVLHTFILTLYVYFQHNSIKLGGSPDDQLLEKITDWWEELDFMSEG